MRWPSWQEIRDPVIVLTSLGLTVYEATIASTFHPELLVFFAGMIATPLVAKRDEARNARRLRDEARNARSRDEPDDRSSQ